ncbi:MAG: histone deacetylase [Proteobacteria bacterium]|nr:histone deacetylase [Pseudomonadota bacterium]
MKTGFLKDDQFLLHDTGPGHPECSARLSETMRFLNYQDWFDLLVNFEAQKADIEDILMVHDINYVKRAKDVCRSGNTYLDSMDVSVCKESYDIALLAAGSAIKLADEVMNDNIDNGFALLRPPGHHAENSMALGFCLFNNIAVLARHLQKSYGLEKIAIIDWDVHHGNGTQHLFEEDPSVLYISTHQYPFYPGTGNYTETGIGKGEGATLNCPMYAGASDQDYESVFTEKILPKIDEFQPEFILISAGFDAHNADPLANINLTSNAFSWMTERIIEKG